MDNPSCPKNIFNSQSPERWAHPNSLGIFCSGYKAKKDLGKKKIFKMLPKQTKRAILSKGAAPEHPPQEWGVLKAAPAAGGTSEPFLCTKAGKEVLEVRKAPAASPAPELPSRSFILS